MKSNGHIEPLGPVYTKINSAVISIFCSCFMLSFNKKASETEMVCKVYHCQNNVLSLTNTNLLMTVTGYNGEKLVFCLYTLVSTVPYKLLANGFHCFCLSLLEEICTP